MKTQSFNYKKSITYIFFSTLIALGFSGWLGEYMEVNGYLEGQSRYLLQAVLMFGMVIGSIFLVRKYADNNHNIDTGYSRILPAIRNFILGTALVILPMVITLVVARQLNWTSLSIQFDGNTIMPVLMGFITVLLFEAIPEELAFRGYIYGALRSKNGIWASAVIAVLLFVLLPLILVPIQQYILGMTPYVGGSTMITGGYIITMIFFGSFVMFLRIVTGSVWMGVGFHCLFVFSNRIVGITDGSIIQIHNQANETAMQVTLITCYLIMGAIVIGNAWLNKKKHQVELSSN